MIGDVDEFNLADPPSVAVEKTAPPVDWMPIRARACGSVTATANHLFFNRRYSGQL
jgi:hypothetical protein